MGENVPVIEIHLLKGYADADKTRLGRALTDATRQVIPAPPEAVTVMTHEYDGANYMRGGVQRSGAVALPDPAEIVRNYLAAMEERDLQKAESFLGQGFAMQFPGADPMQRLEELVDWSKPRYRFVRKSYEGFDACAGSGGAVVYCRGTLSGEWIDGTAFAGIRFIDRFELCDGLITKQDVWNDIAEQKARQ